MNCLRNQDIILLLLLSSFFGFKVATSQEGSSYFFYQQPQYPRDCKEVRDQCSSDSISGVYTIKSDGFSQPFEVYCSNRDTSSGWTVIQRRIDGSVTFKSDWEEYKTGFGFLSTEFWIGNEKLSYLTNQAVYELRIDMTLSNGSSFYVKYNSFRLSDEWSQYKLVKADEFSGNSSCVVSTCPSETSYGGCTCQRVCNDHNGMTNCNDVCEATCITNGCSVSGSFISVFQRRVDGVTDFYRNWIDYKNGFGVKTQGNDFWLGNEQLYFLTNQKAYMIRIDEKTSDDDLYYSEYTSFKVGNESTKYELSYGTYSGNGYHLYYNNGGKFSTPDQDNDGCSHFDCAEGHRSEWWHDPVTYGTCTECYYSYPYCYYFQTRSGCHNICSISNPNGDYSGGNGENIYNDYYYYCNGNFFEMKIRPSSA